ncbi:MAG: MBG domain-containing protein, partial [Bacteroidota bacterium]|nr:MBG domain-containing protein [Bacteroidota bacterium]
ATYSREAGETVTGGPYEITAVLTPTDVLSNYNITNTPAELTITVKAATVAAAAKSKIFGAANPELTATVDGVTCSVLLNYSLTTTAVDCSIVGNYPITVTLGDNPNYDITVTNANLEVQKKAATVAAAAKTKIFGAANPVLTATVTGETCGDAIEYSLSTTALDCSNVDSYPITVTLVGGNSNYTITTTDAQLTVQKKVASVTAVNKTKPYGEDNPALTATVVGEVASCAVINYTLATTAVKLSPVGDYPITVNLGTNPNYDLTKTDETLTVNQATTTTTLTLSGYQVRYVDNLTYTAKITPLNTATSLTGSVNFVIGSVTYNAVVVPIPGATDGSVQAMVINQLPASLIPGNYPVVATFVSTNNNYSGSTDTKTLAIVPRNATPNAASGFYVGDGFAWTTGPSTSTATVTMVAAIKDLVVPSGDVRGAKVSFFFVNGTTLTAIPSAQNLPVGLVDVTDGSVGTASAIVQLNIGSLNSQSFQIAVKITGAYFNNPWDALSGTIVTVSKPVTGGFITGGSSMTNQNSSGLIKGAADLNTDFQFDIQYTKSGTNPKGKATVLVRSWYDRSGILDSKLHTYLIKTNAIALLAISNPLATGTFSAKANMEEQLEDGTVVSVESGATFQMVAFQNACTQRIAITYYRKAGGVWFSSNWDALTAKSVLQAVNSGSQVYVAGGGNCSVSAPTTKSASIADVAPIISVEPTLKAYPNPFTERLNIEFSSATDAQAKLEIYSITGAKLETLFNGPVYGGVLYNFEYLPRLVSSQMVLYHLTIDGKTQVGKVIYNERR